MTKRIYSTDILPMEYPCYGSADLRTPAFHAEYENGSSITKLEYESYKIFNGKKALSGLPATYVESKGEAETLEITLVDRLTGLKIILSYTAFSHFDAIAKSVKVVNDGTQKINIKSILSSTIHLFDKNYDFVHLEGAWGREGNIQKRPLISLNRRIIGGQF